MRKKGEKTEHQRLHSLQNIKFINQFFYQILDISNTACHFYHLGSKYLTSEELYLEEQYHHVRNFCSKKLSRKKYFDRIAKIVVTRFFNQIYRKDLCFSKKIAISSRKPKKKTITSMMHIKVIQCLHCLFSLITQI